MPGSTKNPKPGAQVSPGKSPSAKGPASHILSPAKGPRTIPHRRIKAAVEKVFRERLGSDG